MHKKIVHSFLTTFLITFILGFGLLYVSLYKASISQNRQYLMNTVKLVKNLEIDDLNTTRLGDTVKSEDIRITIIKRNGKVLYDNYKNRIREKHLQREEVKQAIAQGTGTCIRHSDTMQRSYLYVADYEEDNQTIVRLAMPFDGLSQSISILLAPFLFSIAVSFMVVFVLSKKMANEIVEPFKDITNTINSTDISKEVLSFHKYNYPELYGITDALTKMSEENKKYLERLEKEKKVRQEFFSNASHELKTPLTSIRGYTELIRSHTIQDSAQIDTCLDCVLKESDHMTQLINVIKVAKPTILVGTSTNAGAFTKEVVEAMCENTARPVIFPISNPTKKLEATAEQVIEWSDGKAFVATGVPSGTIQYKGVDYQIGQANNALIYPGLGLGMLASEASLLTDEMIGAAAHSLSGLVDLSQPGAPVLPPFEYVADVSIKVAEAVANKAKEQGLAQVQETDMAKAVQNLKWYPTY